MSLLNNKTVGLKVKRYHTSGKVIPDKQGALVKVQDYIRLQVIIEKAIDLCNEGICVPDSYSQPCADEFVEAVLNILKQYDKKHVGA